VREKEAEQAGTETVGREHEEDVAGQGEDETGDDR
jgi:hypothetical protein